MLRFQAIEFQRCFSALSCVIVLSSCITFPNSLDRDGSLCHRDHFPVVIESILDRDGHAVIAANVIFPSGVYFGL